MSSENSLLPLPDTLLRPMVEQALSEDVGSERYYVRSCHRSR